MRLSSWKGNWDWRIPIQSYHYRYYPFHQLSIKSLFPMKPWDTLMKANINTIQFPTFEKFPKHKNQASNFPVLNQRHYRHYPLQIQFKSLENFQLLIQDLTKVTLNKTKNNTKDSNKSKFKTKNLQHSWRLMRFLLQLQYSISLKPIRNPMKQSFSPHSLYNKHHHHHPRSRLTYNHLSTFQRYQQEVHCQQMTTTDRT